MTAEVIGLVGGLFEWLPTHERWAGVVAGPLALLGYLVGSIPFAYLLSRRRLRRQLDGAAVDGVPAVRAVGGPLDVPGVVTAAALSGAATLLVATVAWDVGLQVAPRSQFSAIGTFANQALGAWASIALWTGAGAVVGHAAPIWHRDGGSGLPPAVALTFAYTPLLFVAGTAAFLLAQLVTGSPRRSLVLAVPVVVSVAYLTWILDVQAGWGVTNGPESTLWVAVVGGVLVARNLRAPDPEAGRRD
jgi:glycerol-3-phosphate acyltransferase PlsY